MSVHHQDASQLRKFMQSPHRKRVCLDRPCNGGKFVYASAGVRGFTSPMWYELPALITTLYRTITTVNTRTMYYADESSILHYWHTAVVTIETVASTNLPHDILSIIVTGSDSGLLYSKTWNAGTCDYEIYTRPSEEYVELEDPNGAFRKTDEFFNDPEWTTNVITGVSETVVSCHAEQIFPGSPPEIPAQVQEEMDSVTTVSDAFSIDGMGDELCAMLATVPLASIGASPNKIVLSYDECGEIESTTSDISFSDDECIVNEARQETFTPASLIVELPPGGSGDGIALEVDDPCFSYQRYEAGLASFAFPTSAQAHGKKSMLRRSEPDDWVLVQYYDPVTEEFTDTECLGEDLTKCRRFYYPDGADSGGGPSADNMFFEGNGVMYREIPLMSDPPPDPPCPSGFLDFDNPCLE